MIVKNFLLVLKNIYFFKRIGYNFFFYKKGFYIMTTTIGKAPVFTLGRIDIVDGGKKGKVGFVDISKIESLNSSIKKTQTEIDTL